MPTMAKWWQFFNGHKTTIAAVVMMAAIFGEQVVVGIWQYNPLWMPKLLQTLDWVGMALGSVGLAHKGIKRMP